METQPVRLNFESRGCDPGVPVSLQIVHHLIMIMTRKQEVYEELWWFSVSSQIAANFLKDFDHALSFKLRSALCCPIIGSPLPINWCRDHATEIGRKIVKTSRDVIFFFLCSIMLRICTNSIQVEFAGIIVLIVRNWKMLESAQNWCPNGKLLNSWS